MGEFGVQLKRAREQRGISLRQIATATKISMGALEALERDDFSRLPGGIFSRAFVRAYAIEVGLDPDQMVQEFLEEYERHGEATAEKAPPEVTADDRAFLERQRRAARWLRAISIALLVFIAAIILIWRVTASRSAATEEKKRSNATEAKKAAPPSPSSEPHTTAADSPPPSAAAPVAAPTPTEPATPTVDPDAVRLHLEITSECWVRVTVDGNVQIDRVLEPGDTRDVPAGRDVYLQVGNAGGVKWTINGRAAKPLGLSGQIAAVRVSRVTMDEYVQ